MLRLTRRARRAYTRAHFSDQRRSHPMPSYFGLLAKIALAWTIVFFVLFIIVMA